MKISFDIDGTMTDFSKFVFSAENYFKKKYGMKIVNTKGLEVEDVYAYTREMLKLYPGVIKIALNSNAAIIPVGNEIHIVRDKDGGRIISDVNYTMFEDYNRQALFRPNENANLATLHKHFKDVGFADLVDRRKMESYIRNGRFTLDNITIELDEILHSFLLAHPKLKDFANEQTKGYFSRCAVLYEYNKMLIAALNELDQRMKVLSEKIGLELDKRHPLTSEMQKRNSEEYPEFIVGIYEKISKKGRTSMYDHNDKYINTATDESIIESTTRKVLKGLELRPHK